MKDLAQLSQLGTTNLEAVPLEEVAFLVAHEKYPDMDFEPYRERLNEFANRARMRIEHVVGGRQIAEALGHYLFEDEGFRGNTHDYYDPANSYLNDVLDRREGIPITLSLLVIAIGRRLNLPLSGVGFPGHFLVRYDEGTDVFFIDPFHRGKILSDRDCQQRLREMYGDAVPFAPEFLNPSRHRDILLRMLHNLKMIYMTKRDFTMALQMLNRILLFNPYGLEEFKERGMIYYHMECFQLALKDLSHYLEQNPRSHDRQIIEGCIEDLKEKVALIQ